LWQYYQNGEFVNIETGLCLGVEDTDGEGEVDVRYCINAKDQMWQQYNNNVYLNKQDDNSCLTVSEEDEMAFSKACSYNQSNFFTVTDYNTTTSNWRMVACNQSGSMTLTITQGMDEEIT